jgi:fimbrial chaperone protein
MRQKIMVYSEERRRRSNWFMTVPALVITVLSVVVMAPSRALAGNFSISPTSLELRGGAKSGAFSIINSGSEKLNCQIEVKEWSQGADGKDVYSEAKDIVFFPKIMTVEPNEQRAVRVGVKGPPSMKEKTYRLFIEEIPSQEKAEAGKPSGKITAGLTIAFRYATPIFVKPVKQEEGAVIDGVALSKGIVTATVRNTGNIHIKLLSVAFRGKARDGRELFSRDAAGWYILHGMSRRYESAVPKEVCKDLATIDVVAQAENFTVNGTLNVQGKACTE